ncbi:hypothetical protein LTE61_002840 [Salmonella enterica subsp. enterica serovar Westminster]|nr:hypothetical protein [Salmonella enterica subsp. enterica serovar Westminster]
MNQLIVKERQRVIQAMLDTAKAKTGKFVRLVKLRDGYVAQTEITEEILTQVLISSFEAPAANHKGVAESERLLLQHYRSCINPKTRALTAAGVEFMDAVIKSWLSEVRKAKW